MLETVKSKIAELKNDSTTFNQFYIDYMMKIQDKDLDNEIKYTFCYQHMNILQLDKLIDTQYRELVKLNE